MKIAQNLCTLPVESIIRLRQITPRHRHKVHDQGHEKQGAQVDADLEVGVEEQRLLAAVQHHQRKDLLDGGARRGRLGAARLRLRICEGGPEVQAGRGAPLRGHRQGFDWRMEFNYAKFQGEPGE